MKSVIILGAGLSWLSAAVEFKKNGIQPLILEARERSGGRVFTKKISETLHTEMWGERIGKTHKRMIKLCKDFNINLIDHTFKERLIISNTPNDESWGNINTPRSLSWKDKFLTSLQNEKRKYHFEKLLSSFSGPHDPKLRKLDKYDYRHFLIHEHIPKNALEGIEILESLEYGEDIRNISTARCLMDHLLWGEGNHMDYTIQKWNQTLCDAMIETIWKEYVKFNHIVKHIHQDESWVTIRCDNNREFKADYIVCTLPTFAMLQIARDPILPEKLYNCMMNLNYNRIIKGGFLFWKRFRWDESKERIIDRTIHQIYHSTKHQPWPEGVLNFYSTWDRAYILSKLPNQEIFDKLKRALGNEYKHLPHFKHSFKYYRWTDPYTKGAYAIFNGDQRYDFRKTMSKSFEHIHFAWEHLALFQWFMEGAVETWQKAAHVIIKKS